MKHVGRNGMSGYYDFYINCQEEFQEMQTFPSAGTIVNRKGSFEMTGDRSLSDQSGLLPAVFRQDFRDAITSSALVNRRARIPTSHAPSR